MANIDLWRLEISIKDRNNVIMLSNKIFRPYNGRWIENRIVRTDHVLLLPKVPMPVK